MTMKINRNEDTDSGLVEWLEKLPPTEPVPGQDALSELYFQVYPTHSGAELHFFLRGLGIGPAVTPEDAAQNERGKQMGQQYLSRKMWEKLSGDSLA